MVFKFIYKAQTQADIKQLSPNTHNGGPRRVASLRVRPCIHISPRGSQGPATWAVTCHFPGRIGSKLDSVGKLGFESRHSKMGYGILLSGISPCPKSLPLLVKSVSCTVANVERSRHPDLQHFSCACFKEPSQQAVETLMANPRVLAFYLHSGSRVQLVAVQTLEVMGTGLPVLGGRPRLSS